MLYDPLSISARNGPTIDGTSRNIAIIGPFARIQTTGSDFNIGGASGKEFYIGKVEVNDASGKYLEKTYETAIVMRESPSSSRYVLIPFDSIQATMQAQPTFQNGVPMGIDIKMEDLIVRSARNPASGALEQARIQAPYVEIVSGDPAKGFSIGSAKDDSFYFGSVEMKTNTSLNTAVIRESPSSDKYVVVPIQVQ